MYLSSTRFSDHLCPDYYGTVYTEIIREGLFKAWWIETPWDSKVCSEGNRHKTSELMVSKRNRAGVG